MKISKSVLLFFLFAVISLIPLKDLFHPGLPITHDGQDHVARIANFYLNLQEGNFIPRWAPNLNWGYGHPILMFLYPLPSYFASFFHFFGFSFVDSVKLVFGVSYILSGITMYLWLREAIDEYSGVVGGLLYLFAPYRFVDLYVRGAIGEHVAFIFPPLLFYFLLRISKKQTVSNVIGGGVTFACLILAHNAISLMFVPLIMLYIAYLLPATSRWIRTLFYYCSVILLGFALSAFFWIPAFLEGKYTLRDIVTTKDYATRFVPWQEFFYKPWSYGISGNLSVEVGIVQWVIVFVGILSIFIYYKKNISHWKMQAGLVFLFFIVLFLMTSYALPIWSQVSLLQKFQFPWRFLSVIVFITAALGGYVMGLVPNKRKIVTLCIVTIALLFFNKEYWHAKAYLQKPESYFRGIYNSTTDTGESAPIWSVRFMEKRPAAHTEVIDGKATVRVISRSATSRSYQITAQEKARIRENTLYFPGWVVYVDNKPVEIQFQDANSRGLMTYSVEPGKHTVDIRFGETRLRNVANSISIASLLCILVFIITKGKIWRRFR